MYTRAFLMLSLLLCITPPNHAQDTVFPGADESTPSRSEYFSWINNTNEGATEAQTLINLDFFQWMKDEFGMALDIYAFDAGAIDGKRFYGSVDSERFREQSPRGFDPMYEKAKALGTRLGVWGGPDGFGDTPEEEATRIEQMVGLCRDYEFALFKFDSVCGPLRPEKEDAFIRMMTLCRQHSPDLILLNHRLGLARAQAHATTFLWEGMETYIDVFSMNTMTAPHHRAGALFRGLVPGLKRLTEDHGVCLSSCLDHWEDELILQAFNRNLILSPQLYGSPWFLADNEYPRLARIFNLHRKYRDILVKGQVLPEETFGPFAVSRGNETTRLVTLRNLTWEPITYTFTLGDQIGLTQAQTIHCRQFHPMEKILGDFEYGASVDIEVPPFRSYLLLATSTSCDEPGVAGCEYDVVRNVPGKSLLIDLKGMPGTTYEIALPSMMDGVSKALIDGEDASMLLDGKKVKVSFPGAALAKPYHRKLAVMKHCTMPADANALYEATVFAADSNALEVRTLERSGPSTLEPVTRARDAFFSQRVFTERGIWDRNLFDGNMKTGFWPSRKYRVDQRVKGGCFRLDLGEVTDADKIIIHVPDEYSLQPLLHGEGNHVDVSTDLVDWRRLTYLADKRIVIEPDAPLRYLRFRNYPDRIVEIEAFKQGKAILRNGWRASNLFAHVSQMQGQKAWHAQIKVEECLEGGRICIAVEGMHGVEGAYAALKDGDRLLGCPDRAPSYPSNTWEYVNARSSGNYTYYLPVTPDLLGKTLDVYVVAFDKNLADLRPVVWLTANPCLLSGKRLELIR